MQIFIHEFLTGGGLLDCPVDAIAPSLLIEGRAMLAALAHDFACAGQAVSLLRDARLPALCIANCDAQAVSCAAEHDKLFSTLAATADWTVVIAPEIDGRLAMQVERAIKIGGHVLAPDLDTIRICSDKHATAERLSAARIPVPFGIALEAGETLPFDFPYPAVLKPRDGAGSQGIRRIASRREIETARVNVPSRLERYHPGLPASVAVLCGPAACVPLAPCYQCLADDGTFAYVRGELPLDTNLAERSVRLAKCAVAAFPGLRGYVGIDLVLGSSAIGNDDHVIEINPRLTTSYIGLRALCEQNLAATMLEVARGQSPALSYRSGKVEFQPDGRVRHLA